MEDMIGLADESQKEIRIDMIRKALRDKAPLTYAELEESGSLSRFLEDRDEDMMKYFSDAKQKAWQETLSVFLDFFDPTYDETSSPM